MDTNQVITEAVENNEEAIETAAEAISEAKLDRYINTGMACWGVGIVMGIALTKYVLTPVAAWVKKWKSRKSKVVEAKAEGEPPVEETTDTKEPETASGEEKPEEK